MPQEIIKERLLALTPEYREFIFSGYPEMTAAVFGNTLALDPHQIDIFENGIVFYLLIFFDEIDLMRFFIINCHLSITDAVRVVKDIIHALPKTMTVTIENIYLELLKKDDQNELLPNSKRREFLNNNSDQQIKKYLFAQTSPLIFNIANKYNQIQTADIRDKFITVVGDIILGFYKIEDTVPLLQQELALDEEVAKLLGADVLEFLAPLSDSNWQPPEEFESIAVNEEEITNQTVVAEKTEMAETSHVIPNNQNEVVSPLISSLRTITKNINNKETPQNPDNFIGETNDDEQIYTSAQDNIRHPLSNTPSYTAPIHPLSSLPNDEPNLEERPRWSDN